MGQAVIGHSQAVGGEALPVSNGKLAMWLFLSTEVMFFAALLGSYLVLRWSAPGGEWPDRHAVHVQPVLGVVNTLILVASSLAMARAASLLRSGAGGTCRLWMLVAFLLGLSFLGIKSIEYNEKYKLGLLPAGRASLLHDRADVYYLSRLKAVLSGALGVSASGGNSSTDRGATEGATNGVTTAGELADSAAPALSAAPDLAAGAGGASNGSVGSDSARTALLFGGVNWTEQQLGKTSDAAQQQELLDRLAEAVYPLHGSEQRAETARREQSGLRGQVQELQKARAVRSARLNELQERISQAQAKLAEVGDADKPAWTSALEKAKAEASLVTTELTAGKAEESAVASRIEFLQLLTAQPEAAGLDRALDLNLPKVLPQGRTWANTYFLLTGCHALHLIAGLIVIGGLLCTRLGSRQLGWVENTSLYWQFVDVVWLVLFPLIYLL
ncbi:MAG: cytochrome c oxidase subunit 3 [Planctomycetota bacterium]